MGSAENSAEAEDVILLLICRSFTREKILAMVEISSTEQSCCNASNKCEERTEIGF